jgi:hypothetical protein
MQRYVVYMTLHQSRSEVGARELHGRLSGLDAERPFEDFVRRGLVRMPKALRSSRTAQIKSTGSVSDLVSEQRA